MLRSLGLLVLFPALAAAQVVTFSIVAYDPVNADWGVAVASRYFSVGSVVPWAAAEVGAIATQANVNVGYGPRGLRLLPARAYGQGSARSVLAEGKFDGKNAAQQVAIIDAKGNIAAYTGPGAPKWAGDRQGKTWSAQGNILVGPQVVESMGLGRLIRPLEETATEFLYAALNAGDEAGGTTREGKRSDGVVVRRWGSRNTNKAAYIYVVRQR